MQDLFLLISKYLEILGKRGGWGIALPDNSSQKLRLSTKRSDFRGSMAGQRRRNETNVMGIYANHGKAQMDIHCVSTTMSLRI
eukprot:5606739-Amphidinium_carterae.1